LHKYLFMLVYKGSDRQLGRLDDMKGQSEYSIEKMSTSAARGLNCAPC
jgi:hypothetical protein